MFSQNRLLTPHRAIRQSAHFLLILAYFLLILAYFFLILAYFLLILSEFFPQKTASLI